MHLSATLHRKGIHIDRLVMAALADQQRYKRLIDAVPKSMMAGETNTMLAWYNLYFKNYPTRKHINWDELISLVRLRSTTATAEQLAVTLHMVDSLRKPVDPEALAGTLAQLYELDFAGRAGAVLAQYNNGEEVDVAFEIGRLAKDATKARGATAPDTYIDTPIGELLAAVSEDKGLKFRRISALREGVLGMQGGASVLIAARPDKGKTSFIADTITDMAPQCVEHFGADRPVLWLCNEGDGRRIIPRIYQAALGKNLYEITSMSNAGTLVKAYCEAINGPSNYIRVKNAHGMSLAAIEQVIESMNPCLVIFDMAAHIKLGKNQGGGNKADEVEAIWVGIREMAVIHDFVAMGTCQISAEGNDMLYPSYSALKDSKTAAQGAVDVMIMLGSLENPAAAGLRGVSTPKNKFGVPGRPSEVRTEVAFEADICRFKDGVSV